MGEPVDDFDKIFKSVFSRRPGNYDNRRGAERPPILNSDEIEQICTYLENPTKSGIWYLNGKWGKNEGISKYIRDELNREFEDKEDFQIQSGKREIKINIKDENRDSFFDTINRMTFILSYLLTCTIWKINQSKLFPYIMI